MQHRIIVVSVRGDVPMPEAQRHWRERHPAVYTPVPGLAGYVQNRPLEEEWPRLGARAICSETWFGDQAAERASFGSDYYRDVVMPDENGFLDRDSAWMGRVIDEPPATRRATYRVLAFGAGSLPMAGEVQTYAVDREPPAGGEHCVSSVWVADRERALTLARASGPLAFAAESVAFVEPPA